MDTTPTPADPAGFGSLSELQDRHAELVKTVGSDVLAPGNVEQVAAFIARAAATGGILDAAEDRASAQGLINFWVARLSSASRTVERMVPAVEVAVPHFDDTVLKEFDPDTIRAAADAADAWLTQFEENRDLTRRIMLRLVRLLADGQKFDPVPTVRATLYDLDTPARVDAVLKGLATAGVVRVTRAELPELDRIVVRFPQLTTAWRAYEGWLAERRRFRDAVKAWDQAGRPSAALVTGDRLDEARSYFDRDGLEREFLEQSRHREWQVNEKNRVLKWVFLAVASVAIVATVAAVWGWRVAAANAREATKANADLKTEQQTLQEKQQLTVLRLLVRGAGELAASHAGPEREIAQGRWQALVNQFNDDEQATPLLRKLNLDQLRECVTGQDKPTRLSSDVIVRIRQFRNPILANVQVYPTLAAMREVSFKMVKLSATKTVAGLKANQPYSIVEPYAREFWVQHWGEMLLIEGKRVESAMIAFNEILEEIRAEVENPKLSLRNKLSAEVARYAGGKGKQLVRRASDYRLNASSFARLDSRARQLNIPAGDRRRIQESLYKGRKTALNLPVTNRKLVSKLEQKLQPLLDALEAELGKAIPAYADAKAR